MNNDAMRAHSLSLAIQALGNLAVNHKDVTAAGEAFYDFMLGKKVSVNGTDAPDAGEPKDHVVIGHDTETGHTFLYNDGGGLETRTAALLRALELKGLWPKTRYAATKVNI